MNWADLPLQERAEMILGDTIKKGDWQQVLDEWSKGHYPSTPDGEKSALADLIHLAQKRLMGTNKPSALQPKRSDVEAMLAHPQTDSVDF